MASGSNKFSNKYITLSLLFLALEYSSASSLTKDGIAQHRVKLVRNRRQSNCQDGEYEHEGIFCCLCATGQRLVSHCTKNGSHGECKNCENGMFSSHPNFQEKCELCTSCDHTSANLKVKEPCTPAQDAICMCKEGHYCNTDDCRLCQPCAKCADEGIKEACTSTSNTVCNVKTDGSNIGMIAGIIVLIFFIFIAGAVGALFVWQKRKLRGTPGDASTGGGPPNDEEMQFFNVPDIEPHLPDIAEVLGWRDMKDVASRSGILQTAIEACERNHPLDCEEQTKQLLRIWVEKHGSRSPVKLIEILKSSGKRNKAEKVMKIFGL
ncbi:tumor necrosis factor receptor superfamily member 6-like isoform X1 [Seriola lalandi dorsalis]|uniref:Tumor necrosis factor receptor superfamily member 6 n=1 Tax=Seriola lalandi dorsalis TaxID=1841481 RepID=A0A3B4YYG3_SERLL|nr:tumor necrosis factor receptor superfamily member 6-like isoform X1 [Seriola lalandi dorsalis]